MSSANTSRDQLYVLRSLTKLTENDVNHVIAVSLEWVQRDGLLDR